jgi:hypothetical protein
MRTGKTAFPNSKKALYAIGVISIIPVILGLIGLFFTRITLYSGIDIGIICRRYILYALL